jgi:hypothetical protein
MRAELDIFVDEALPDLDPVIAHEITDYGWRALTAEGEVLEVKGSNGHKVVVPDSLLITRNGFAVGRRAVSNNQPVDIEDYLTHFNRVVALYRSNNITEALAEADATVAIAPTVRARFNRAMVLLAAGRWHEGLKEYWHCEQEPPFMRPQVRAALAAGLRPWCGEELHGKRLLLIHAHGFGDTIQMLRYVPVLKAMGAEVILQMPRELERLAAQCGPVVSELQDADFFCPMLHLLRFLHVSPEDASGKPYLIADPTLAGKWMQHVKPDRQNIGLAWSIGKPSQGDYPRAIPLRDLTGSLAGVAALHSVQAQGQDEAAQFGVKAFEFVDFADCAALMSLLDEIISVDTAALHLAGAIGHPRVVGLLSHWASWRWIAPWYANVQLVRQEAPDDWASALAQI